MNRLACLTLIACSHAAVHARDSAQELFVKGKVKGAYFYTSCGPEHFKLLADNGFNCGMVKLGLSLTNPERDSGRLSSIGRFGRAARENGAYFFPCINYAGHPETALVRKLGCAFVSTEGAALGKTPCPLCRGYWERVIGARLAALAKKADELGVDGLLFDPEMYGADLGGYSSTPCLCDDCFRTFVQAQKRETPRLEPEGRFAWLKENKLLDAYRSAAEERLAAIMSSVREQIRMHKSGVPIGFLNYADTWYYNGLIRGLGTPEMPVSVWIESPTYATGYTPAVKARVESFAKRQMHAQLIGGMWLQKFMPQDLPAQCYFMSRNAGGYWLFTTYSLSQPPEKLKGDYTVPAPQSEYWAALKQANQEIDRLVADRTYKTSLVLRDLPSMPTRLAVKEAPRQKLVRLLPDAKMSPIAARPTLLRGRHTIFTNADAGDLLQIELFGHRLGRYRDGAALLVFGPDGKQIGSASAAFGKAATIQVRAEAKGTYALVATASGNRFSVRVKNRAQSYWAEKRLHVCGYAAPLYFFVPRNVEQFDVRIGTGAELETVKARLLDPAGNAVAAKEGGFPSGVKLSARVRPEHAGKLWQLALTKAKGPGVFEDVSVSLSENLPPYFSESPERLLLPEGAVMRR